MIISINLVFTTLKITTFRAESFAVRNCFANFANLGLFAKVYAFTVIGEDRESFFREIPLKYGRPNHDIFLPS